jgi:hypothetical protein
MSSNLIRMHSNLLHPPDFHQPKQKIAAVTSDWDDRDSM